MKSINEWTHVYLNGQIPSEELGTNNLKEITLQLSKSGKAPNQVYSILRGMGIPHDRSKFAVDSYVINNPMNQKKITVMEQSFNVSDIKTKLEGLKGNLLSFVQEDDSKYRYSAQKALNIVEVYLGRIEDFENKKEELKQVSEALTDLQERENKELYQESILDFNKKKVALESHVSERNNNEKFLLVKKAFIDFDSQVNWLSPVSEMLEGFRVWMNSNRFSFRLREAANTMNSHKHAAMYRAAIADLENLTKLGEAAIHEDIAKVLEKHRWISEVERVLVEFFKYKNLAASNANGTIKKVYSPVKVNEDNSVTFHLDGKFYVLKEGEISLVESEEHQFDGRLSNVLKALQLFKPTHESFQLFNGQKMLEVKTETGQVTINEMIIADTDAMDIKNHLVQTAFFRADESYKIDQVCILIESLDDIKELDFIYSINSPIYEGVTVNVINHADKVYLNRVNPMMGVNELVEADTATKAQSLVSEFVNYDISNMIYEKLEEETKKLVELGRQKEDIKENIKFLEEKILSVKTAINKVGAVNELQEAINLLNNELLLQEKELQKVYVAIGEMKDGISKEDEEEVEESKKEDEVEAEVEESKKEDDEAETVEESKDEEEKEEELEEGKKKAESIDEATKEEKLLDKGYIKAGVKKNTGSLKKGAEIYVNAGEFTTASKKDELEYIDSKDKTGKVKKENIAIIED